MAKWQFIRRFADSRDPHSLASRMRRARFEWFCELVEDLPSPVRVLDIGGTESFWKGMAPPNGRFEVELLNLTPQETTVPWITASVGDATDLSGIPDRAFDVAFSNSVIEHLFTWENQQKMAAQVRRVARRYFVQTPNRYCPLEPHFHVPGFQFLPLTVRARLLQRFSLGFVERAASEAEAFKRVSEIRLLTAMELRRLFPDAVIRRERFAGLTKSLVAHSSL